jgi:hypothetical protein
MVLKPRDRAFRFPKITYIDYKQIEMDRVLTLLFPRLRFDGYASRRTKRQAEYTVDLFVDEFVEKENWFVGFATHRDIARKWVETDLMDLVRRGRPDQAIAAPRPLHGNTYKFRNARHTRDYGAAEQIYWMLYHARRGKGQAARDALKRFFFPAIDLITDKYLSQTTVDVETQALLRLDEQIEQSENRDPREPERFPPLCLGEADLLADDVLRLLTYEQYMPRSVLVEYLKTLFSFHLALYHLRLLTMLPALVQRQGVTSTCSPATCPRTGEGSGDIATCAYLSPLVVDLGDSRDSQMAELARRSAASHYRRIPAYIQAQFTLEKLDQFATYLSSRAGKLPLPPAGYFSVADLLRLLSPANRTEREGYFTSRLASILDDMEVKPGTSVDPMVARITSLGLGQFETYIELLVSLRGRFHHQYITECLDALMRKNKSAGILSQSRGRNSGRRFTLGSQLLELLLQLAVLQPSSGSYVTREIRVEDLLLLLQRRYGLYIDRLPQGEGIDHTSITDREALRRNGEIFKRRLREIGFLQDLSDAYVTQTITPRYTIAATPAPSSAGTRR